MSRSCPASLTVVLCVLSLVVPTEGPLATSAEEDASADAALDVDEIIGRVRNGPASERPYWVHRLGRLGPAALPATRAVRDRETTEELKRAFEKAATWQLATKVVPALLEGSESQLTFAGQYVRLLDEGPEVVVALLELIADAATDLEVRFAACRALADAVDPRLERPDSITEKARALHEMALTRLRDLYHTILVPASLREQIGVLLAVLGDMQAVDASIRRLVRFTASANEIESVQSHILLANLYYRIRDYGKALGSYSTICEFYESVLELQRERKASARVIEAISTELAMHYYNAACSASLDRQVPAAMEFIQKAVRLDPVHADNVEKDGDLDNVRRAAGYRAFLESLREEQ